MCVLTSCYLKKVAGREKIQCDPLCLSVQKKKKEWEWLLAVWRERIMCYFCSLYCSCGIHPGKLHCCWKRIKIAKDTEHVWHYLSAKLAFAAEEVRPSSFYSQWGEIGPFQVWVTWRISDIYFRVREIVSWFPLALFTGSLAAAKSQEGITPVEIFLLKKIGFQLYKSRSERQTKKESVLVITTWLRRGW